MNGKTIAMLLALLLTASSAPYISADSTEGAASVNTEAETAVTATAEGVGEVIASGECGENLTWALYDNGELVISGEGDMENYIYIEFGYGDDYPAPWYRYADMITKVILHEGVASIGDSAFDYFSNLTGFKVDKNNPNYSSDDTGVLFDKYKMTLVRFPQGNNITSYTIPEGIASIADYAFEDCESLISVTMPECVTSIGDYAFNACGALTSITIPDSVTSIGAYAFSRCGFTNVIIPDSVTSIKNHTFWMCDSLTSVTMPEGVTSIGDHAFNACGALTSITIPDSVTSIGVGAFQMCDNLTSVTIPDSVTFIGMYAFASCDNLDNAIIYSKDVKFASNVFSYCPSNLILYGYADSTTETYAAENGHNFAIIEDLAPEFVPGDITGDGMLELSDALLLFKHSMMPDLYPLA